MFANVFCVHIFNNHIIIIHVNSFLDHMQTNVQSRFLVLSLLTPTSLEPSTYTYVGNLDQSG